ncbi:MAG: precorrin-6A/cobalt-precorrin-6A reductase, partial [Streptosporangiaceae bacterium]
QEVSVVVDATHPFATTMSAHAVAACADARVPLLSLVRPPWTPRAGDSWHEVSSLADAAALLPALGRRVFVTTGRQGLAAFAGVGGSQGGRSESVGYGGGDGGRGSEGGGRVRFLIRCVDPPGGPLPADAAVVLARGPYDAASELELMREHRIDVLVTKNSGGTLTSGKLAAARQLGIPVIMVRRPPSAGAALCCSSAAAAARMVLLHWVSRHGCCGTGQGPEA